MHTFQNTLTNLSSNFKYKFHNKMESDDSSIVFLYLKWIKSEKNERNMLWILLQFYILIMTMWCVSEVCVYNLHKFWFILAWKNNFSYFILLSSLREGRKRVWFVRNIQFNNFFFSLFLIYYYYIIFWLWSTSLVWNENVAF